MLSGWSERRQSLIFKAGGSHIETGGYFRPSPSSEALENVYMGV